MNEVLPPVDQVAEESFLRADEPASPVASRLPSADADDRLEPTNEPVEVLRTFSPDRIDPASGPLPKGLVTAAGSIRNSHTLGKQFKVPLLDGHLGPDFAPTPGGRKLKACESPRLQFFPGVLGKERIASAEVLLNLVESLAASLAAIGSFP